MTPPGSDVDLITPGPTPWERPRAGPLVVALVGVATFVAGVAASVLQESRSAHTKDRLMRDATAMAGAMWETQLACEHFLNTGRDQHRQHYETALAAARKGADDVLRCGADLGSASIYVARGVDQARDEFEDWQKQYARKAIAFRLEKGGRHLAPFLKRGGGPDAATQIHGALQFLYGQIGEALEFEWKVRLRRLAGLGALILLGAAAGLGGQAVHRREQRRELETLAARSTWLESLAEFAEHVQHSATVTQAAGLLTDALVRMAGNATVVLRDPDGGPGALIASAAGDLPADAATSALLAEANACPVLRNGVALGVAEVSRGRACRCPLGAPATGGYRCEPLRAGERTVGIVNVRFAPGRPATAPELNHLASLARVMSLSLGSLYALHDARNEAITDPLTGLPNRRFLDGHLATLMKGNLREGRPLALLMLDLDHFKRFNDAHGHPAGDALLKAAAAVFADCVREGDTVARYGGEEFTAVLPGADRAAALDTAERIRNGVAALRLDTLPDLPLPVITLSIGLALAPADGRSATALVATADQALYRAKEGGRNRVVVAGA